MDELQKIISSIEANQISPLYLLFGEESYFIDFLFDFLSEKILPEDQKSFNQFVLYGKETSVNEIVDIAMRYPVMAERQLVIIKEAQQLSSFEKLENYTAAPNKTTVLVLCYKYKKLDKRLKVYKNCLKNGLTMESKKLYEHQVVSWIQLEVKNRGYHIDRLALQLLVDSLGTDLSKVKNELDKLFLNLPKDSAIDSSYIEEQIGVSREFNNFEFCKALGNKNVKKTTAIIKYFIQNPKSNPLTLTISTVYSYFQKLLKYHGLNDKSRNHVAKILGVNPYFVVEYQEAASNYNMKTISRIINSIKKIDLKSKGVASGQANQSDLLKELVLKIFSST